MEFTYAGIFPALRKSNRSQSIKVWVRAIRPEDIWAIKANAMSNRATTNWYAYQGPLGKVVHGQYFLVWKDGFLIGTSKTLEEAMESLVWRERLKSHER